MSLPHETIDWKSHRLNGANESRPLRILAPVDFDHDSQRSRLTAIELAAQWRADVTFLHVSPQKQLEISERTGLDAIELLHNVLRTPAGPASSSDDQLQQLRLLEAAAMLRMKRMIPDSLSDKIQATFAWRSGSVHKQIVDYAREHEMDVIVLGTRDQRRPWRFSGGVVRLVTRGAPCQVLVAYPSGQASVERQAFELAS